VDFHERAERLIVVLVEPQQSGNVGACARAMKNMGLHRLVVVAPPSLDMDRARWMGPGCDDVFASMQIVATLDDALAGVHRSVATTARHRKGNQPVLDPASFATSCWDDDVEATTALLFGREDFGLSRDDVDRCQAVLRIPTPEHASLNLAQAVLLVGNAWFEAGRARGGTATGRVVGGRRGTRTTEELQTPDPKDARADVNRLEGAVGALVDLLDRTGYTRGTPSEVVKRSARVALQSARLTVRDVEALRGMINHLGMGWKDPFRPDGSGDPP
jgi:tRNA/rRNA methyltransferase